MSEAYWIAGGPEVPAELLSRSGARAAHVDALHWMSTGAHLPAPELSNIPTFCWPVDGLLQHALLNFTAQSLDGGNHGMALLVGEDAVALLASPRAVGRDNLMPHARLGPFWAHTDTGSAFDWVQSIGSALTKLEFSPEAVRLISSTAEPGANVQDIFPQAEWMHNHTGSLTRLNLLVRQLEVRQAQLGLLLSLPVGGPWLATLVERI